MATLDRGPTLGAYPIQFATDFSGMDMTAFALKQLLPDDGLVEQLWACDIWKGARWFYHQEPQD